MQQFHLSFLYVIQEVKIIPNTNETHSFLYECAVNSIRNIPAYSDEAKYPEIDSLRNFDCIEELGKDCEQ